MRPRPALVSLLVLLAFQSAEAFEPVQGNASFGADADMGTTRVLNGNASAEAAFPAQGFSNAPGDENWSSAFGPPGGGMPYRNRNGLVFSLAMYQGALIAGGDFFQTAAGDTVKHIATFDGDRWVSVGGGVADGWGITEVSAMTVHQGELIVVGHFTKAGEVSANSIAAWNGTEWRALGSGVTGAQSISAVTVHGSDLIVGGDFTSIGGVAASNVARWDGFAWYPLGSGITGVNEWVSTVASFAGSVFVGGSFTTAGGVPVQNIASWDGSAWHDVNGGTDDWVRTSVVHDGYLVVGGRFYTAGVKIVRGVARWDGDSWRRLGEGFTSFPLASVYVASLCTLGTDLIASGYFNRSGGDTVINMARWDGTSWSALCDDSNPASLALIGDGSLLYAGGQFNWAGTVPALNVAAWTGPCWTALGFQAPAGIGLGGSVSALAQYGDKIVLGGPFGIAGQLSVTNLATFDGTEWDTLGSLGGDNVIVNAFAERDGALIIAGKFASAGGESAGGIVSYQDGMPPTWDNLDGSFEGPINDVMEHDGKLVAGGAFYAVNGQPWKYVAEYNGASWAPVGGGLPKPVNALAEYNGDLIVGGEFDFVVAPGETLRHVARWDGTAWHQLGSGLDSYVIALATYRNELIAGGRFQTSGGTSMPYVARWDGTTWRALRLPGEGANHPVWSLAVKDTLLLIGGEFTEIGGIAASGIAGWTGEGFIAYGSGAEAYPFGNVYAILPTSSGFYMGGNYGLVGGKPCYAFAEWLEPFDPTSVDEPTGGQTAPFAANRRLLVYPSPAVGPVGMLYRIPFDQPIDLVVYDASGRQVRALASGRMFGGVHTATWDRLDSSGREVAPGTYFVRLTSSNGERATERITIVR
jgi:trimeric autotransporter adhesin